MGMMPHDFWHEYTYGDFIIRMHYFYKEREMSERSKWERARYLATVPLSLQYGTGNKEELLKFPWDKITKHNSTKPMSTKEAQQILDRYNNMGLFGKSKLN